MRSKEILPEEERDSNDLLLGQYYYNKAVKALRACEKELLEAREEIRRLQHKYEDPF